MGHRDPGAQAKQRARQMRCRADPGRPVGDALGLRTGPGEELHHRFRRIMLWRHHHHIAVGPEGRGIDKAAFGVIGQALEQILVDRQGADGGAGDGVTVGRRLRAGFHADVATGAGAILDHEVLAQAALQLVRQDTRQHIGSTAGRERHDDLHRPIRPIGGLRGGEVRGACAGGEQGCPRDRLNGNHWIRSIGRASCGNCRIRTSAPSGPECSTGASSADTNASATLCPASPARLAEPWVTT